MNPVKKFANTPFGPIDVTTFHPYPKTFYPSTKEFEMTEPRDKTEHQQRVEEFMKLAGQEMPDKPMIPDEPTRLLRAKLMFEECVQEAIWEGLAVDIKHNDNIINNLKLKDGEPYPLGFSIASDRQPNLVLIADGCADVSVVTIGTLSACGIADKALLEEVDQSNLAKFVEPKCPHHGRTMTHIQGGMYGCATYTLPPNEAKEHCHYRAQGPYRREDGKWIKSPDWKAPDIKKVLMDQMPKAENPSELLQELSSLISKYEAIPNGRASVIIEKLKQTFEKWDGVLSRLDQALTEHIKTGKTQEIRVGSVSDNDLFECLESEEDERLRLRKEAKERVTGNPLQGVLPSQKPMTLCGECRAPLSDELVRKVRISPRDRALSESQGLYQSIQYVCPECQKGLIVSDLIQAT